MHRRMIYANISALMIASLAVAQSLPTGTVLSCYKSSAVCLFPVAIGPSVSLPLTLGHTADCLIEESTASGQGTSILVAGNASLVAHLSRVTVAYNSSTNTYSTTSALIATSLGSGSVADPANLAWENSGSTLLIFDRSSDSLYRIDPTTGTQSLVYVGTSNDWGNSLQCGSVDPATGDIYVAGGTVPRVWKLPSTATMATTPVVAVTNLPATPVDIKFDPINTTEFIVFCTTQATKHTITNSTSSPITYIANGVISNFIRAAASDQFGDFLVAAAPSGCCSNGTLVSVPNPVGQPPIGGVSVVGVPRVPCWSTATSLDIICIGASQTPFTLYVTPNLMGQGSGLFTARLPYGVASGATLLSASTGLPAGTGLFVGLYPDPLFFSVLQFLYSAPQPGHPFRWSTSNPSLWPNYPLAIPANTIGPSTTLDFVLIGFDAAGNFSGHSNIVRASW